MQRRNPHVLTINGGSSTIKFALYSVATPHVRSLFGRIERIGTPDARLRVDGPDVTEHLSKPVPAADHTAAVNSLMSWLEQHPLSKALIAVGHRVVHGGPKYIDPQRITGSMLDDLQRFSAFDPNHLPEELLLARAFHSRFPLLPQVACFDTAFHKRLPEVARLLAIPRRYEAMGVRRYGFHGLSYAFLMHELSRLAPPGIAQGRVVLAHLGGGASLAALRDGQPVDTSMGFTPASGIPMGTRSGDVDPGLSSYLAQVEGMTPTQFGEMTNSKSGLLGVSETTSDMRDLCARRADDSRADLAIALFCYQVKKCIGAFAAALGGLDTLVFSGGIGEDAPTIRAQICEGLEFLGVVLDRRRNDANESVISIPSGSATVHVIRTNEELMIARAVCDVLNLGLTQDS